MERGRWRDQRTVMKVYAKVARSRVAEVDSAFDSLLTDHKRATNDANDGEGERREASQSRS
jgi:hypothetical protein